MPRPSTVAPAVRQIDEALHGTTVCQEVVDDEKVILRAEVLPGDDDIVIVVVGIGVDHGVVNIICNVGAAALLGKDHRHTEVQTGNDGNANAAGLDGEDLVDGGNLRRDA